jgi:hypothetical protein
MAMSKFLLVEDTQTKRPVRMAKPTGRKVNPAEAVALTLARYPNVMAHLAE